MAITWEVTIKNVEVDKKRANVAFLRTDTDTGATENYRFDRVTIETPEQRSDLLNLVWSKHLEEVGKQSAIGAFITNLEQTAISNLEAREA